MLLTRPVLLLLRTDIWWLVWALFIIQRKNLLDSCRICFRTQEPQKLPAYELQSHSLVVGQLKVAESFIRVVPRVSLTETFDSSKVIGALKGSHGHRTRILINLHSTWNHSLKQPQCSSTAICSISSSHAQCTHYHRSVFRHSIY